MIFFKWIVLFFLPLSLGFTQELNLNNEQMLQTQPQDPAVVVIEKQAVFVLQEKSRFSWIPQVAVEQMKEKDFSEEDLLGANVGVGINYDWGQNVFLQLTPSLSLYSKDVNETDEYWSYSVDQKFYIPRLTLSLHYQWDLNLFQIRPFVSAHAGQFIGKLKIQDVYLGDHDDDEWQIFSSNITMNALLYGTGFGIEIFQNNGFLLYAKYSLEKWDYFMIDDGHSKVRADHQVMNIKVAALGLGYIF